MILNRIEYPSHASEFATLNIYKKAPLQQGLSEHYGTQTIYFFSRELKPFLSPS